MSEIEEMRIVDWINWDYTLLKCGLGIGEIGLEIGEIGLGIG